MNILAFPMTPRRALELIREAVAQERVIFPALEGESPWYRIVTRRQVMLCLKEGELTEAPAVNQHGDVQCRMAHFSAGVNVRLSAVLKEMGGWTAIIIEVENKL
ncbi:hypothetical protein [Methylomagnum sp.]